MYALSVFIKLKNFAWGLRGGDGAQKREENTIYFLFHFLRVRLFAGALNTFLTDLQAAQLVYYKGLCSRRRRRREGGGGGGCVGDQHEASERQKAAMSASKCVCVREHEYERVRVRVLPLFRSLRKGRCSRRIKGEKENMSKQRKNVRVSCTLSCSRALALFVRVLDFDAHSTALTTTVRESSMRLLLS